MLRGVTLSSLLTVTACHFGGGPVLAVSSRGHARLGVEASGGLGFLRGSVGGTFAPSQSESRRTYLTFDPGIAVPLDRSFDPAWLGGGVTLGASWSGDERQVAAGAWTSAAYSRLCREDQSSGSFLVSVAVGGRWLGGVTEWFVAPKAGAVVGCVHHPGD